MDRNTRCDTAYIPNTHRHSNTLALTVTTAAVDRFPLNKPTITNMINMTTTTSTIHSLFCLRRSGMATTYFLGTAPLEDCTESK